MNNFSHKNMKSIDIEELKVIQMDILEVVDRFCIEHNIRYSLACGSCLGAVRHKGYIPWDDDIDIYIPREDYERFINIFPKEFENIKVASLKRDTKWNRAYAKAYDARTIMEEECKSPMIIGVGIDIYPIDNVPDSEEDWLRYNKKRRILVFAQELKVVVPGTGRSVFKNILLRFIHLFLLPFSSRNIAKYIDRYAQKNNGKGYNRSFECVQGIFQKHPFNSSLLTEFIRVPFEDRQYLIMKDFDAYLTNGFGDYMQLPPVEKRVSHHDFKAYWK